MVEISNDEIAKDPFLKRILDRAEGKKIKPVNPITGNVLEKKTVNRNILTVKTKKTFQEFCREIYQWSVRLSGEQEVDLQFIRFKPEWLQLYSRLSHTQGNLIKVVGPQGSGKTTLSNWLYAGLPRKETAKIRMIKGQEALGHYEKYKDFITVENSQGKDRRILNTEKDWSWNYDSRVKTFIIDLWDYGKNSRRDITKALDAIQDYWNYSCNQKSLINIVVFLQKEALPLHFFLGKMEYFEVKPWKPKGLVECYKSIFGSYDPFTEEVLTEIAYLSRGIFRNFKRYISYCLDFLFEKNLKGITQQDLRNVITTEKIVQDMELQLSELFPRSKKNRVLSVKVLRFLREHGQTQQKILEEQFFNDKMSCSRILNTLTLYGYLKFTVQGRTRLWEIQ